MSCHPLSPPLRYFENSTCRAQQAMMLLKQDPLCHTHRVILSMYKVWLQCPLAKAPAL